MKKKIFISQKAQKHASKGDFIYLKKHSQKIGELVDEKQNNG